jgi:hypothetical protein
VVGEERRSCGARAHGGGAGGGRGTLGHGVGGGEGAGKRRHELGGLAVRLEDIGLAAPGRVLVRRHKREDDVMHALVLARPAGPVAAVSVIMTIIILYNY